MGRRSTLRTGGVSHAVTELVYGQVFESSHVTTNVVLKPKRGNPSVHLYLFEHLLLCE